MPAMAAGRTWRRGGVAGRALARREGLAGPAYWLIFQICPAEIPRDHGMPRGWAAGCRERAQIISLRGPLR